MYPKHAVGVSSCITPNIHKDGVNSCRGEVYHQLRPGEKSKPVPNMDDPSYSHVHLATTVEEPPEAAKKPVK